MKQINVLLFLVLLLIASLSHAARDVGNGGGSWVCREPSGEIRWSRLIDTFEAENEFGLTPLKAGGKSVQELVRDYLKALGKMDLEFSNDVSLALEKIYYLTPSNVVRFTDQELEVIDDSIYRIKPRKDSCLGGKINYEQVVNFKRDGQVLVQKNLHASLSKEDQAALILHEGVYAVRRLKNFDINSLLTRRIVGEITSMNPSKELINFIKVSTPLAKGLDCSTLPATFKMSMRKALLDAIKQRQSLSEIKNYIDACADLNTEDLTSDGLSTPLSYLLIESSRYIWDGWSFPIPQQWVEDIANLLLDSGASVASAEDWAIIDHNLNIFKRLVRMGFDINGYVDRYDNTLQIALNRAQYKIVEYLISINVDVSNNSEALCKSVTPGHRDDFGHFYQWRVIPEDMLLVRKKLINHFISQGSNPNLLCGLQDDHPLTVLSVVSDPQFQILEYLAGIPGINLNALSGTFASINKKETALIVLIQWTNRIDEILKYLRWRRSGENEDVIARKTSENLVRAAEALIKNGADKNIKDTDGKRPYDYISKKFPTDLANRLKLILK